MANIAISNVGNSGTPATYDGEGNEISPAIPAAPSPSIKIIDENGVEILLTPGMSRGLALGHYTIQVVE